MMSMGSIATVLTTTTIVATISHSNLRAHRHANHSLLHRSHMAMATIAVATIAIATKDIATIVMLLQL